MFKVPLLRHQRYISPSPLTSRVKSNDKTYQGKKCRLWHLWWTCYGQLYWTKLSGYHIHTMYCKFDHSEMIFGPFEKMTFFGEHPLIFGQPYDEATDVIIVILTGADKTAIVDWQWFGCTNRSCELCSTIGVMMLDLIVPSTLKKCINSCSCCNSTNNYLNQIRARHRCRFRRHRCRFSSCWR